MDTGYPEGSATVVAFEDGNASIYLSGGGFIGGIGQASVREAAEACVQVAATVLSRMHPTNDFPLPEAGETIFYVLTGAGVLTARAAEEDLGGRGQGIPCE